MTVEFLNRVKPLRANDPSRLGSYRLVGRLGLGGMGVVYLATDRTGKYVAVKLVHASLAGGEEFRRRFGSEVNRARQVPPFCTAEVLDADLEHEPPYLVVEYVDGPSLAEVVEERGPLNAAYLHSVAIGVATALTAIHGAAVIHRDLKPSNVLLAPGSPKVIDFGIARAFVATSQHTSTDQMVGTIAYMAPERFGPEPITPAADIFAWGVVVAYAGTGRTPFGGDSAPATAGRILTQPPDLAGLAEPLRGLVELALAKDPAARPHARQLLDLLLAAEPQPFTGADTGSPVGRDVAVGSAAGREATVAPGWNTPVAAVGRSAGPPWGPPAAVMGNSAFPPGGNGVTPPSGYPPDRIARHPGEPAGWPAPAFPHRTNGSRVATRRWALVLAAAIALIGVPVTAYTVYTGGLHPTAEHRDTNPTGGGVAGSGPSVASGPGLPSVSGTAPSGAFPTTTSTTTGAVPAGPGTTPATAPSPTPVPKIPVGGTVLFKDSLKAEGQWIFTEVVNRDATCTLNGVLRASRATPGTILCIGPAMTLTGDHSVAVDVNLKTAGSCAGIWFSWTGRGGYVLRVCQNVMTVGIDSGTNKAVISQFPLAAPIGLNESNRIQLVVRGNNAEVYRGSQYVGSAPMTATSLPRGEVVLGVTADSTVARVVTFANVEIRTYSS